MNAPKKQGPQKPTLVKTTPDGGIRLHITVEISGAELRAWDTARLGVFFSGLSGVLTAWSVETVLHGLEAERERTDRLMKELQEVKKRLDEQKHAVAPDA